MRTSLVGLLVLSMATVACGPDTPAAQGNALAEADTLGNLLVPPHSIRGHRLPIHFLDCGGSCPAGETCGGGGTPGVCGPTCVPITCAGQGANCGSLQDNCGSTLDCGDSCPGGQTCGGGGTANVCGQAPSGNDLKESWVWVYADWDEAIKGITNNKASFTHVSPTFYTVNYDYQSGAAYFTTCPTGSGDYCCTAAGADNFDGLGLTARSFTASMHAVGMKVVPAIYGGAANGGSDAGIMNILRNATVQAAFISAMVTEAVDNDYDGYNLDWEASAVGASYAQDFVKFANAFKAALSAARPGASLSADAIVSNVNGTWCSGNDGYLDFALLSASSLDRVIIENYTGNFQSAGWTAPTSCSTSNYYGSSVLDASSPTGCDYTFTGMMLMMCPPNLGSTQNADFSKAVIGLMPSVNGTNPIAGQAMSYLASYGFTKVAAWPQYDNNANPFMSTLGMNPSTATWYGLLQGFLAQ
jgi:hypothetical protein